MNPWDELIQRIAPDLELGEAELRRVTQRVEGLRFAMKYAREAKADALARQPESPAPPAARQEGEAARPPLASVRLAGASPTRLSEVILHEARGEALTTQVTRERVNAASGQQFSHAQVKAALTYLHRKGRVEHVGTALWRLPRAQVPSEDFTPAAETAGVSTAGENGHSTQSHVLAGAGTPHSQ